MRETGTERSRPSVQQALHSHLHAVCRHASLPLLCLAEDLQSGMGTGDLTNGPMIVETIGTPARLENSTLTAHPAPLAMVSTPERDVGAVPPQARVDRAHSIKSV